MVAACDVLSVAALPAEVAMKHQKAAVAAAFTAIGILMLAIINFMLTPGYIWFYYPAFVALWVPLSLFFFPKRGAVGFALAGSALTITFLAVVTMQNSPGHLWFLYSVLPLAWWPVACYASTRKKSRWMSLVGSALSIAWLVSLNYIESPAHPWFLYACYPFLWWPIVIYSGRKAGTLAFSLVCSAITIAYYAALNLLLAPGYPWAIYPAFAILWWPLSMFFARRKEWLGYSFAGSLWTITFFLTVNLVSSPSFLWAIFPVFAVLWWPLSMYFAKTGNWLGYSAAGAGLASAFFIAVNLLTSPGFPWALFPVFLLLWWPLSMLCARRKSWMGYSVAGTLLASAFFLAVNLITSPGFLWSVFPIFAVLWWPLAVYFFKYRKRLLAQ